MKRMTKKMKRIVGQLGSPGLALCLLLILEPSERALSFSGAQQDSNVNANQPDNLLGQSQADADRKSAGCNSCHTSTDSATMHTTNTVRLGCTDCHGGDASVTIATGIPVESEQYVQAKKQAHPHSRFEEFARTSANPVRVYATWLKEDPQYIAFINPGDLRVAENTCGRSGCHVSEVFRSRTSMMSHGAMLWSAALYNNGSFPFKNAHFGES
jgi:hypothetical protein